MFRRQLRAIDRDQIGVGVVKGVGVLMVAIVAKGVKVATVGVRPASTRLGLWTVFGPCITVN